MTRSLLRRVAMLAVIIAVVPFVGSGVGSSVGNTFHFALIGDLPYTTADSANMPAFVADISRTSRGNSSSASPMPSPLPADSTRPMPSPPSRGVRFRVTTE